MKTHKMAKNKCLNTIAGKVNRRAEVCLCGQARPSGGGAAFNVGCVWWIPEGRSRGRIGWGRWEGDQEEEFPLVFPALLLLSLSSRVLWASEMNVTSCLPSCGCVRWQLLWKLPASLRVMCCLNWPPVTCLMVSRA